MNVELQINNSTNPGRAVRLMGSVSMPDPRDQSGRRHGAEASRQDLRHIGGERWRGRISQWHDGRVRSARSR